MDDEFKLTLDASRAVQANGLLENELLKEAFAKLEQSYIEAWRSTQVSDQAGREKLFLAVNVIGKVREHLIMIAADGKVAEAALRDLYMDTERKRRFGII